MWWQYLAGFDKDALIPSIAYGIYSPQKQAETKYYKMYIHMAMGKFNRQMRSECPGATVLFIPECENGKKWQETMNVSF